MQHQVCPPTDWREYYSQLLDTLTKMSQARGYPPPKLAVWDRVVVEGTRIELPPNILGLYDADRRRIVISKSLVDYALAQTDVPGRWLPLAVAYHEFKHHEQFVKAGFDPEVAFDRIEGAKDYWDRKYEKQAFEFEREAFWKFRLTLNPVQ